MDRLSTEVWLRVFTYLHTIDILYSFSNLNNRLEELIIPFQCDINLSAISFQSLKCFVRHILPICNHNIRSFTLKNGYQMEFCMRNNLFRSLLNLQRLRLVMDPRKTLVLYSDFFSNHFRYLVRLIELDLYNVSIFVHNFASFIPSSLTHLNLGCANESLSRLQIDRLRNLKVLKTSLKNVNDLFLIESLHNLRELYLYLLLDLDNFNDIHKLKLSLPKSFVKLHIEYRELTERTPSSWGTLKVLLNAFGKRSKSLTLIINSKAKEYADFDQFQQLQKCFLRLTSFQYLIHTPHCPSKDFHPVKKLPNNTYLIYTMKPHRPISYFQIFNYDFFEVTTQYPIEALYFTRTLNSRNLTRLFPNDYVNIYYKLPHLRHFSQNMLMMPDVDELVLPLLFLTTKINSIQLTGETPEEILRFLKRIPTRKRIDSFRCRSSKQPLNSAYFFALSRNLPRLKYLYLDNIAFFEKRITADQLHISISLIDGIQKYLKNVILIQFSIRVYDRHTMAKSDEYKNSILWLNQHSNHLFYVDHVIDTELEIHLITVWL